MWLMRTFLYYLFSFLTCRRGKSILIKINKIIYCERDDLKRRWKMTFDCMTLNYLVKCIFNTNNFQNSKTKNIHLKGTEPRKSDNLFRNDNLPSFVPLLFLYDSLKYKVECDQTVFVRNNKMFMLMESIFTELIGK